MKKFVDQFVTSESGATLVEYGVALLVAIIVGGTALTTLPTLPSRGSPPASNPMDRSRPTS